MRRHDAESQVARRTELQVNTSLANQIDQCRILEHGHSMTEAAREAKIERISNRLRAGEFAGVRRAAPVSRRYRPAVEARGIDRSTRLRHRHAETRDR